MWFAQDEGAAGARDPECGSMHGDRNIGYPGIVLLDQRGHGRFRPAAGERAAWISNPA